jgi:hypothetical protein
METYSKFVFRSKPPRVTLGGYKPPDVKVKPWEVPPKLAFKESEILSNLKAISVYVKPTKDNFVKKHKFPSAVIPDNLGNS